MHCTAKHSTAQYSTSQFSTAQYRSSHVLCARCILLPQKTRVCLTSYEGAYSKEPLFRGHTRPTRRHRSINDWKAAWRDAATEHLQSLLALRVRTELKSLLTIFANDFCPRLVQITLPRLPQVVAAARHRIR